MVEIYSFRQINKLKGYLPLLFDSLALLLSSQVTSQPFYQKAQTKYLRLSLQHLLVVCICVIISITRVNLHSHIIYTRVNEWLM